MKVDAQTRIRIAAVVRDPYLALFWFGSVAITCAIIAYWLSSPLDLIAVQLGVKERSTLATVEPDERIRPEDGPTATLLLDILDVNPAEGTATAEALLSIPKLETEDSKPGSDVDATLRVGNRESTWPVHSLTADSRSEYLRQRVTIEMYGSGRYFPRDRYSIYLSPELSFSPPLNLVVHVPGTSPRSLTFSSIPVKTSVDLARVGDYEVSVLPRQLSESLAESDLPDVVIGRGHTYQWFVYGVASVPAVLAFAYLATRAGRRASGPHTLGPFELSAAVFALYAMRQILVPPSVPGVTSLDIWLALELALIAFMVLWGAVKSASHRTPMTATSQVRSRVIRHGRAIEVRRRKTSPRWVRQAKSTDGEP